MCTEGRGKSANKLWDWLSRRVGEQQEQRDLVEGPPIVNPDNVQTLVDELPLPATLDLDRLREIVAALRMRPIEIAPYPAELASQAKTLGEPLPSAMCFPAEHTDFIWYRNDTTASHQRHAILHEIGHLCCRHTSIGISMNRSYYEESSELAAETFAYALEQRFGPLRATRTDRATDPNRASVVDRFGILEG